MIVPKLPSTLASGQNNCENKIYQKTFLISVLGLQSGTPLLERITLHLFSLFSFVKSLLNGAAAMNQRY